MENLFNNPILLKLQEFGQKMGTNKFVAALQAGMMFSMSILMVGSLFQIVCTVGTSLGLFTADSVIYQYLYAPYNYTMGLIGLWVTGAIAYNYSKNLKMKSPLIQAINACIVFMMTCAPISNGALSISFLSSTGMFIGFVIAWIVVRIDKLCADKNVRIPMPDVCPPSLVNSMAAILPLFFDVVIIYGISLIITIFTDGAMTLPTVLNTILYIPLSALVSVPGMFIINGLALLLWCFGIHGTMIVYPVLMADMINAAAVNAQLHAAGLPFQYFPSLLFAAIALAGSGNTWPLTIMGLRAKSEQIRAVSKVSVVPNWFGINEPCVFGMPIMYNPILCIPYVLNGLVITFLYHLAYTNGWIIAPWITISALLPVGFGAYLGTLNIMNVVFVYLMMVVAGIIWFPFFKIYDNQLYAKEQAAKAAYNYKMNQK